MSDHDLPYLDITAPGFSTRSKQVMAARAQHWCARTPFGLAVLRHRQAGLLLRDRRLRQGSYAWPETVGLTGSFADFWRRSLISQEGAAHRSLRRIAQAALSNDYVQTLSSAFEAVAHDLLAPARRAPQVEFMTGFSERFAGRAVTTLLGLGAAAATKIARDASTLGFSMGLDARSHQDAINAAHDRLSDLAAQLIERARRGKGATGQDASGQDANEPGHENYVARLLAHAEAVGLNDDQSLTDLIVISIFGGVDTTRAQLGFLIALLAEQPEQWAWLRADPARIPDAVEEAVRTRPTTTWSTREAVEDVEQDGITIRAGQTVHILAHATATDPLIGDWQGFDVRAPRKSHFGFGGGAHHCLGQFVARTDMACAMRVLLTNWKTVRLIGSPRYLPESGNTSPVELTIEPDWE